ncbi:hypothetical protein BJ944DRAFT_272548 [Cunninghamella echinulata]|nr:hypothetical protein BJ944DRAFT_272548 [Cunninghamella echinulata]
MQKLSYALKPRIATLIKNGYQKELIRSAVKNNNNASFSLFNKKHNHYHHHHHHHLYYSTQSKTIETTTTNTTTTSTIVDNDNNNDNNNTIITVDPAITEYRQAIATANTLLNNNKNNKTIDKNIAHQLWHQYKAVQDHSDFTREDYISLRSILWKNKSWGSEDRILDILEDMKKKGHEWTLLEYNEYFLVKLYQAKYQDILTMYDQAFVQPRQTQQQQQQQLKEKEKEEEGLRLSIGSFNAILATFIKLEQEEKAALFIRQAYEQWDIIPDIRDFGRTMHRSIPRDAQVIEIGRQWITTYGMMNTKIINTNLQHLLREKKTVDDALWLYETLKKNQQQQQELVFDTNTYSLLIRYFMEQNKSQVCLALYDEMKQHKIKPNPGICSSMLTLYAHKRQMEKAEQVVKEMILAGHSIDEVIYNQLIKVYFKARKSYKALQAFEEIQRHPTLQINEVILNTMIDGLVMNRELKAASHLYLQILAKQQQQNSSSSSNSGIRPDTVTFNTLFKGYMEQKDYLSAMGIIQDMYRYQCEPDTVTFTTMMSSMFEQTQPSSTIELLTTLNKRFGMTNPNIYTFNAILNEWVKHQNIQEMEKTYHLLQSSPYHLQPTIHTFTNMMQGYADNGMDLIKIMQTFQTMVSQGIKPDRASYHFLISGFLFHHRLQDAWTCFLRMRQADIHPTKDTWHMLMDECIHLKQWDLGKQIVKEMDRVGFNMTSPSLRKKYFMLKKA